jgi:galactose mutarotase-like enzyme
MIEHITVENSRAWAEIRTLGAELRRYMIEDRDLLWCGDEKIWSGTAPILFPIVGALRGNRYRYGGRTYEMAKHGFARQSIFAVTETRPDRVTLTLESGGRFRESFPFDFRLTVTFALEANGALSCTYGIGNPGETSLPCTIGSHPGFRIPFDGGTGTTLGSYEDYLIRFERVENLQRYSLEGGLLSEEPTHDYGTADCLQLNRRIFDDDALIFQNLKSSRVALEHRGSGRRITVETGGAPHLGLWAKPGASYVCIEPWFSVDDKASADYDLTDKPGILSIAPGESFTTGYRLAMSGTASA